MKIIYLLTALFIGNSANAFYATLDNGDLVKPGEYKVLLGPQFLLSDDTGINISGRFDFGFNEESNFRTVIGAGTTNFFAGLFYKWIPIPDIQSQPAIGLETGVIYGTVDDEGALGIRLHPLISKKFATDWGDFTPHASVPFGFQTRDDESSFPIQLALGVEYKPVGFKNVSFMGEAGFDLNEAFNYISIAAVVKFDGESGFKIE